MKKLVIKIDEKKYEVTTYLSLSDTRIVGKKLREKGAIDYKLLVAEIIAFHSNGGFDIEEAMNIDDATMELFVEKCIDTDDVLKENFETIEAPSTYERYVLAIDKTSKYYASKVAITFQREFQPQFIQISKTITMFAQSLVKQMSPFYEVIGKIGKMLLTSQHVIQERFLSIANAYANFMLDYGHLFSKLTETIEQFLRSINIPTISEEEKEQLIRSFTTWGTLGWTVPPNSEINLFSKEPKDPKDAYQKLKTYLRKDDREDLFEQLRQTKKIRKSDLNEAIRCFNGKNYKGCALVIFSMIDARLIRSQKREDCNRKGMRSSGKAAAEKLFRRIEANHVEEFMLFTMLNQVNIYSAMKTFFDHGNDFKIQPEVINRNFVTHGMLHRNVSRRDCIMLFLLLYNFTEHINSFNFKN